MDNARIEFLFQRYVNGGCTREEELELIEFITNNDNDHPQVRRLLNELWNSDPEKLSPEKTEVILDQIISARKDVIPIYKKEKSFRWTKVAAGITLLALSGTALYQFIINDKPAPAERAIAQIQPQHQFIKLPDGSTVTLNASSSLEYPDSFSNKNAREVTLTGEAFFDIRHDPSKPFIVHTEKLTTTVLGTAFNVRAYPEQNNITITVTRGKVKVSDESKVLGILTPDQQITFSKNSQKAEQTVVRSEEAVSWTERDIFFDDMSMAEAVDKLKERFNVQITFDNEEIKECRFTATFIKGEDLRQILNVICEFNNAEYTVAESGSISISGNGCSP